MTRAYIRLDPAFDERKETYPDGPYAALIATLCLAELQPERGRFRSLDYLSRLLGKRGRHTRYLVDHGDLTLLDDGHVYVDGWDEWQEGDWKVAERVGRIRNRQRRTVPVTPPVTVGVTVGVTPDRLSVAGRSAGEAVGGSGAVQSPRPNDPWDDPEMEAVTWLAAHGCDIRPGNGYHKNLVTLVEAHGINAVIGLFDRLAAAGMRRGDTKGYVFGAKDALDSRTRPDLKALEKEDRAEDVSARIQRSVERTKTLAHENGYHIESAPGCPKCAA